MMTRFMNRIHAGQLLAQRLSHLKGRPDVKIVALPRGGVPVAFEVATATGMPLDVLIVRKLGVPSHEELAMGAIASGGVKYVDKDMIKNLGITKQQVAEVVAAESRELVRRESLYRKGLAPLELSGFHVVLVDDGLATGATMHAAIQAIRTKAPKRITVAVPVAPAATCGALRRLVDDVICLQMPEDFMGVGECYADFTQTSDASVVALLHKAQQGA